MANASVTFPSEVDVATVEDFGTALQRSIDGSESPIVVIDLASVTFIGTAGFHALVDATEYALSQYRLMTIRNLDPFYAEVMRLCDWHNELVLDA